jgi:hypothetical protein
MSKEEEFIYDVVVTFICTPILFIILVIYIIYGPEEIERKLKRI